MLHYADFKTYLAENEGQTEEYLRKIETQWQAIQAKAYAQIKENEPVTAFLDCIRYALIMASVNNVRLDVDGDYEEQYYAVTSMLWANTPEQDAIKAYLVEQVIPETNPFNQLYAYCQLAAEASDEAKKEYFQKQIEAILPSIQDIYQKASAFYQYVTTFDLLAMGDNLTQLEAYFEAVPDPWEQAHLYRQLSQLEAYPKQDWALQTALEKVLEIDDSYFRVTTLGIFLQQQPLSDEIQENFKAEMQATAPLIKSIRPRLQALYYIYQFATPEERQQIIESVFHALEHELPTEYAQLGVIQYYVRIFTDNNRTKLMDITRNFENPMYRSRGLAVFLPNIDMVDKQTIQRDVLDSLADLSIRSRSQMLSLFMRRELFSGHVWGEDIVNQIAQVISEVCSEWDIQA